MTQMFMLGDEAHAVGDITCPACPEAYPHSCPCGGLMHACGVADIDAETVLATQCDRCSRSIDDFDTEAA